jgi:hypothetical protein
MSQFLYAWEHGANLGHVGRFEPVAQQLKQAGHGVTFAVRETEACSVLLGDRFPWLQAPVLAPKPISHPPINYADILLAAGYDDPVVLWGLFVAWRTMLQLMRPDLIFADYAPTAILAARTLGIPVMLYSSGFGVPPNRSPMPVMRPWEPVADEQLKASDAKVLSCINVVLERTGSTRLQHLCDLFDVAENALLTLPELDHYYGRENGRYWGMLPSIEVMPRSPIIWPAGKGPRLFAYIRHDPEVASILINCIADAGCPSIIFYPEWSSQIALPLTVTVITAPADLSQIAAQADVGIAHGTGTISAFLRAGKPILCVASHLEQFLFGLRVAQIGVGLVVRADEEEASIKRALQDLLFKSSFTIQAQKFAEKYSGFDSGTVLRNICTRALELVNTSRTYKMKWTSSF